MAEWEPARLLREIERCDAEMQHCDNEPVYLAFLGWTDWMTEKIILKEKLFEFESGAKRSEKKSSYGYMPGTSLPLTAARFEYGHWKFDKDQNHDVTEIYNEANWRKAVLNRDIAYIRQIFSHAIDHLWAEMRGDDDPHTGGNLGAIGWAIEILSYVQKHDPELYAAARGLIPLSNH